MPKKIENTLYVTTQGAYIRKRRSTLVVEIDGSDALQVPGHHIGSLVAFGRVVFSPTALAWCAENGVRVSLLSQSGRFEARVTGPTRGNVLLRLDQYRAHEDPDRSMAIARSIVRGKIENSRHGILRSARDSTEPARETTLREAAGRLDNALSRLERVETIDEVRGIEGECARHYFAVMNQRILVDEPQFAFDGRTRRPPRDRVNSVLSFLYVLLLHDVEAALEGVGLDPQIGFLHSPRPGRASAALDLMEELRPVLADGVALALINRRQLKADDFTVRRGGAVRFSDDGLKTTVAAYQAAKMREVTHHGLNQKLPYGLIPHVQARILARHLRGDIPEYEPYIQA